MIKDLFSRRAPVNAGTKYDETALQFAAEAGSKEAVEWLCPAAIRR